MITGLVRLASNSPDYETAVIITGVIYDALVPVTEGVKMPLDGRVAFALDLIVQFRHGPMMEMLTKVEIIVKAALGTSLSGKTFKAVARQRHSIMDEFIECAKLGLDRRNKVSEDVLRLVKKIALLQRDIENYISSTDKCDKCQKCLSKAEANQCGSCLQATYCSRKCQQKHWFKHRHLCKHIAHIETTTTVDTKTKRQEKALVKNITAVVDKLMAENWMNILAEATLLGYDIEECAVVINLIHSRAIAVRQIADLSADEKLSLDDLDMELSKGGLASICYPDSFCGPTLMYSDEHRLQEFASWKDAHIRFRNGDFTDEYHNDKITRCMADLFFRDLE